MDTASEPGSESLASPEELRRLRLAVEASGEVIFMTDANGTINYVNPEFVRVYGYTPSEVVGRSTPRILKSGTTPDDYASFWQELLNNRVVRREFLNRTKSGNLVQVERSANPIFTDDELVGFLAVQRDITARKSTEAALRESEMRYRTLAEAAHDSIFIVDREARIEYANSVSTERFGTRSEDAIGKRLHELFPHNTAEEMWRQLSTVFATGERRYSEARFSTPNGDLWLETWLVPMTRGATGPDAVMGVARDITARKALERQFLQAQKMEAVGRLAGGIAHDFNNLLTAIIGYCDLVLENVGGDPELAGDVQEIKKAGERAGRLTRQLLAFSRKQVLVPRVLDLNEIVMELQKMLGRVIGEDISLEIVTGPDLEHVRADPGQLEQLIVNLAVNARDAMPKGGSLRIATANAQLDADFASRHDGAVPGRYVSISVQDTGCGMTSDVLAHVFEPFFTTKPVGKGTGLGLATVYGIVKQSGGCITIDSTPGAGTVVMIYLPIVHEPLHGAAASPTSTNVVSGTETILLVEDEPGLRHLMERTLARSGYTVLTAQNGTDAIASAESHSGPIHLMLSDVIMPGLSGPDLAQRIVRLRPDIKVLYVSGFTNHAALGAASRSPRTAFLAKPFTPQILATHVRECLDRQLIPL